MNVAAATGAALSTQVLATYVVLLSMSTRVYRHRPRDFHQRPREPYPPSYPHPPSGEKKFIHRNPPFTVEEQDCRIDTTPVQCCKYFGKTLRLCRLNKYFPEPNKQGRIQEIASGGYSKSGPLPIDGPYLPKYLSPDFEKLLGFRPLFYGPLSRFFFSKTTIKVVQGRI